MNIKKCLAMLLALCMALALCACNADEGSEPSTPVEPPASMDPGVQQTDPGDANPDVSFDLQEPPAPDFDSPATGDDSGKIYTIEGDYAYEMDPVTWLKRCAANLDYVHFKDVNEQVYREVLGEKIRFFEGCAKGAMCPIGKGILDYPGIKEALEEIGYSGYIAIEQERDPRNSDTSLRDVKASVTYLKSVGYEI